MTPSLPGATERDGELERACWELVRSLSARGFRRTKATDDRFDAAFNAFLDVVFARPEGSQPKARP